MTAFCVALLPVIGQNFRARLAKPGAILFQARQHNLVAVVDLSAAESRDIPRAGVVSLLRRGDRSRPDKCDDEKKCSDEKKSGHVVTPTRS